MLLERHIHIDFYKFLIVNNLLYITQSVCCILFSSENELANMTNKLANAIMKDILN